MDCAVEIVGLTERGLVRESNEDSILVGDLDTGDAVEVAATSVVSSERGPVMILCDGMGGSAGGGIASSLACATILRATHECPVTTDRTVLARNLRRAVRLANQAVFARAEADKKLRGMGTTTTVLALCSNTAVLAHVGDSRGYVLRRGRLSQVTRDQSVVSAMVQSGKLSEERAPFSMQRGRILQAVGAQEDVEVSLSIAELRRGDRILLCSDGLHEYVAHDAIREACALQPLQAAAHELIAQSHAAGAPDNVSILLAEVSGEALRNPLEGDGEVHFVELDPSLEGESALSTTSIVGRRLAHEAGLRDDAWPRSLPATAQHPAIPEGSPAPGPAERALDAHNRVSPWIWVIIAALALVAIGLVVLS